MTGPGEDQRAGQAGAAGVRAVLVAAGCAVVWAGSIAAVPTDLRGVVGWSVGGALLVVCAVVLGADHRIRRVTRDAELRVAQERAAAQRTREEADHQLREVRQELHRAGEEYLPWLRARLPDRSSVQTILADADETGRLPRTPAVRGLMERVTGDLSAERRRLDAAVTVMQECAQRQHAGVTELQAELARRRAPYWHEEGAAISRQSVREDFEALDTRLARMELVAQSLLVLTGSRRTGRAWPRPVELDRVLRAAIGHAKDHQRVDCALPKWPLAVTSRAINSVIHVLGQLLDNALQFSTPTSRVVVSVEDVTAGVVVHVDDSGLAMAPQTLEQARRTVDLGQPLDITTLSGVRLGLAAARASAQRHDITITFGPSPQGGTRASALVPRDSFVSVARASTTPRQEPVAPRPAATPPPSPPPAPAPAPPEEVTPPESVRVLPKRSPGSTLSDETSTTAAERDATPHRTAEETARRLGAFQSASRRLPHDPAAGAPIDTEESR